MERHAGHGAHGEGVTWIRRRIISKPTVESQVSEWLKKDAEAKLFVEMSVSDAYKPLLLSCDTSKDAVDKLSLAYNITSEIAKQILWQKFFEHFMTSHQSMASYLASVELLSKQLRDAGETVSDTCHPSTTIVAG